jgi:hypothetical protein
MLRNSRSESNQLSSALYGSFIPPSGGTAIKDENGSGDPPCRRPDRPAPGGAWLLSQVSYWARIVPAQMVAAERRESRKLVPNRSEVTAGSRTS